MAEYNPSLRRAQEAWKCKNFTRLRLDSSLFKLTSSMGLGHGNASRGYSGYNCWVGAANSTKIKSPASGTDGLHCQRRAPVTRRARPVAFTAALAGRRGFGGPDNIAHPYRRGPSRCGLLDVGTPGGLEALRALRQALPDLKIVAIAVSDIEQEVVACSEAGVSGFVSRDGSIQDLVTAVHCAMRNEFLCSPRIAALLFSRVAANGSERSHAPDNSALTRREHEIVSLMTQGLANKEIARQLRIQNATVKNHIHSILAKLHVRRRGEVAARMNGGALRSSGVPSPQDRHLLGSPHHAIAGLD
jgi:DNA-binding NarL/FixJ family response regulator